MPMALVMRIVGCLVLVYLGLTLCLDVKNLIAWRAELGSHYALQEDEAIALALDIELQQVLMGAWQIEGIEWNLQANDDVNVSRASHEHLAIRPKGVTDSRLDLTEGMELFKKFLDDARSAQDALQGKGNGATFGLGNLEIEIKTESTGMDDQPVMMRLAIGDANEGVTEYRFTRSSRRSVPASDNVELLKMPEGCKLAMSQYGARGELVTSLYRGVSSQQAALQYWMRMGFQVAPVERFSSSVVFDTFFLDSPKSSLLAWVPQETNSQGFVVIRKISIELADKLRSAIGRASAETSWLCK